MKKTGCFFTSIIFVTIAIGIIFYIGKKYGSEWFEIGKGKVLEAVASDFDDKIKEIKPSGYKDSLLILVDKHVKKLNEYDLENIAIMEDSLQFIESLEEFISDKIIDSEEINKLTEIYKKYERK